MAEEADKGVVADVSDAPITDAPVEPTTEVESPTTEQATEEVTNDAATSEDTEPVETETAETEDTDVSDETLAPKSKNRFQKLANENRELKSKIAQLEELAVPTEQDYLDGGYDATEAKLNALEARFQQQEAIARVADLNRDIDNDMVRIVHEYPQLDPKNPQFNKDLAINLFNQYDRDSGAKYTEDGITLETNQLPYEYIKAKMELVGIASRNAKVEAQKSVEKMVSVAETPAGSPPKEAKDMTIEEMEAAYGIVRQ